jgi:hypothetical protein
MVQWKELNSINKKTKREKTEIMKKKKIATMMGVPALALVLASNAQAAMSITMMDNTGLYSAGDGGEFRAVTTGVNVDWADYSLGTKGTVSAATDGGSWGYNSGLAGQQYFQTFCTELTEEFSPGYSYDVSSVGDAAMYAGTGHAVPITVGVAYLYSQFAAGTLAGYDYSPGPSRQTTWDLQNAIWDLLGEGGYMASWIKTDLAAGLPATPWTAAANGAFGVQDMVLDKPGQAQDQLVMTGVGQSQTTPVPEPTTMVAGALLLLPFGMSTLRILRKQRTA